MGAGDDRAGSAARGAGCSPAAGPTSLSPWSEGPARCSLSSRDSLGDALSRGKGRCVAESNPQDIDIDAPVPRPRRRPDRRGRHVPHGGRGPGRRRAAQLPPEMRLAGHRRLPGYVGILLECRGAAEAQKVHSEAHWHRGERRGRSYAGHGWRSIGPCGCSLRLADFDADADALEALAEIDGILTFKAARDTIREACVHAEDAWRATWDPATDWDEWNQAVWVGFHGAWEAARTAADDVWLKDADYALDATLGAAATVWSRPARTACAPPVTTCNGRR